MILLLAITIVLFAACIFFMHAFLNHKITIETLNQELNLSNEEYVDLFIENVKISDELSSFKVLERIKNLQ